MRDDKWWKWSSDYSKIILYKNFDVKGAWQKENIFQLYKGEQYKITKEYLFNEEDWWYEVEKVFASYIRMSSKFRSVCSLSGRKIDYGDQILYNFATKKAQLAFTISGLFKYKMEDDVLIETEEEAEEKDIVVYTSCKQIPFRPLIIDIYHNWIYDWINEWLGKPEFEQQQQFESDDTVVEVILRELHDYEAYPKTFEDQWMPFLNLLDFKAKFKAINNCK